MNQDLKKLYDDLNVRLSKIEDMIESERNARIQKSKYNYDRNMYFIRKKYDFLPAIPNPTWEFPKYYTIT